ncbi:MAG TPA: phosphoribosyltransferase [Acidimicrobiales bacterium]|nr:phosphoribosyltransferase [Acidimicrobiales bacterium]
MDATAAEFSVCTACEGPTQPGFGLCFCCSTLVGQLQMPLAPVTAVTPYRVGDEMHRLLRGYKDASSADARSAYQARLAGILRRWTGEHLGRLLARTGGPWDLTVGVPSSHRPTGTPVDTLLPSVPDLARTHRQLLMRGTEPTDHLVASRLGFTVRPPHDPGHRVRGLRALVVDDSFTTGARAQSATAALRMAGLRVAGVLVVGRVVAPETASWQKAYWESTAAVRRAARAPLGTDHRRRHAGLRF